MEKSEGAWGRTRRGMPESWPRDAFGAPEEPARLGRTQEGPVAGLTRNMLEAYGIPVVELSETEGAFARVLFGASAYGVGLFVPASRLEEARDLVQGEEEDPALESGRQDEQE